VIPAPTTITLRRLSMAKSPSRVAAINLGMQTVTMAVFSGAPGDGLTLDNFAQADLLPDPSADASRAGQLRVVLSELRGRTGWKDGSVGCAIPSQGVFARFVQIPAVEADKAGQMILFEAQQNVPYPIEEIVWDYQVLPDRGDGKFNALIIATKSDALAESIESLQHTKLSPELIEVSTSALYNAFRFNYPDLRGCSLLVDIGARTTNLLFIEGNDFFIRTLPIGGSSITAALHKKFDTRSFQEVEDFKRAEGHIPPPGNYAGAKTEDIAEMGKIARTVMTRIHNEITRSIAFYRNTQKGSAPMRALLAGGGASLPYALEFFNEKLSLPIEFFNPLRRVGVSERADTAAVGAAAHRLGECVGLALRLLPGDCPVEISLKAEALEQARAEKRRRPFLITAAALLIATPLLLGLYYQQSASALRRVNDEMTRVIDPLRTTAGQIRSIVQKRDALLREEAEFAALPLLRTGWAEILNELNQRQPEKFLWITGLAPAGARSDKEQGTDEGKPGKDRGQAIGALTVRGLYLENPAGPAVVDAFVEALSQSELFDISEENRGTVIKIRSTPTGEAWAYDYELLVPLKRPIPTPM